MFSRRWNSGFPKWWTIQKYSGTNATEFPTHPLAVHVHARVEVNMHKDLQYNMCAYIGACVCVCECAKLWVCAHMCECMQTYTHEAWTYAIQPMHAALIQTIDRRALHKHMQFNLSMLQSCKQLIKELNLCNLIYTWFYPKSQLYMLQWLGIV